MEWAIENDKNDTKEDIPTIDAKEQNARAKRLDYLLKKTDVFQHFMSNANIGSISNIKREPQTFKAKVQRKTKKYRYNA